MFTKSRAACTSPTISDRDGWHSSAVESRIVKGGSSKRRVNAFCRKAAALASAGEVPEVRFYSSAKKNPADRPSQAGGACVVTGVGGS